MDGDWMERELASDGIDKKWTEWTDEEEEEEVLAGWLTVVVVLQVLSRKERHNGRGGKCKVYHRIGRDK